jgi:hypothetical protein
MLEVIERALPEPVPLLEASEVGASSQSKPAHTAG